MTILIMAGSFGVNNILSVFREITALPQDFQMIIITGRNEKLYHAFEEELPSCPKPCKLVYFTKEVEKYMKAANLIVTKPGGLTVSEALACNIPLAVFDAIPGQEEDNANFPHEPRHGGAHWQGRQLQPPPSSPCWKTRRSWKR